MTARKVDARTLAGQEMCALRKPGGAFQELNRFKVTARYWVQLTPRQRVACVRVSCYAGSGNIVWHFSLAEFRRLFRRAPVRGQVK